MSRAQFWMMDPARKTCWTTFYIGVVTRSKGKSLCCTPVNVSMDAMPIALEGVPHIADVLNLHIRHHQEGEAVHSSDIGSSISDLRYILWGDRQLFRPWKITDEIPIC